MTHFTTERPEGPTSSLVTFFNSAKDPAPVEDISIEEVFERIRSCTYQRNVDEVLAAPVEDQQSVKARVLPAFTPAGRFSHRSKDGLVEHSGFGIIDIDDKTDAEGKKARLALDSHVYAALRSPRGGVKVLFPMTVVDTDTGELRAPVSDDEHKAGMAAAFDHFAEFGPDPSGSDVARLCYFSADPDVYVNEAAEAFEIDVESSSSSTAAINDVNQREKNAAGRAPFEATIPQGMQYATLLMMVGALRRLGLGEAILLSVARKVFDDHLENPNNWSKVESMVRDIAEKPVESHTTAEAMARRAALTLKKWGMADEDIEEARRDALPWRPFPVGALPGTIADYVRAQAAAIGVDPAFIAVPGMAVLASAVGNSYRIGIKEGWTETSALWTVIVAESGVGKSPALQAAMRPIYELEREAKEAYEAERAAYDALDKEAQKAEPEPQRRRYRVGDTTIESLVMVHDRNPRGLAEIRDELGGWLGAFDRYARGEADLQSWIEMHGGRPIMIDRKSSTPPVLYLESPHVSVAGGIQPAILRSQLGTAHFTSGFAARLLLAEPPTRVKGWTDADVMPEVSIAYARVVRALYALPMNSGVLTLTLEAKEIWVAFYNENAAKQHALPGGPLKAALSKHEALAARFALVLHLADHVDKNGSTSATVLTGPISGSAMRRGVLLARWFRYETARLYQKYGVEKYAVERDVCLSARLSETCSWRDIAELWEVEKSNTFKTIIPRLIEKGLIEKAGHGTYRRLSLPDDQSGFVDFGDFEPVDETLPEDHAGLGCEVHESPGSSQVPDVQHPPKPAEESPKPADDTALGERPDHPHEIKLRRILSYERERLRLVEVPGPDGPIVKRVSGIKRTYGKTYTLDEIFGEKNSSPSPDSPGEAT